MDKSETYRMMCEQAIKDIPDKPILPVFAIYKELWEGSHTYDLVFIDSRGHYFFEQGIYKWKTGIPSKVYPLYSQNQLQEMVKEKELCDLIDRFVRWEEDTGYIRWGDKLSSMEQLWLAFVMQDKYQKVWNGTDWIKESHNE